MKTVYDYTAVFVVRLCWQGWPMRCCFQQITTGMYIIAYILLGIGLGYVSMAAEYCKINSIQLPVDGQGCDPPDHVDVIVAEHRHCTLACIHSRECKATIYNNRYSVCMRLQQPCIVLSPSPEHVYQSFRYPCTKWVPKSDDVQGYWVYESGTIKSYITLAFMVDDLLLGKATQMFYTIDPTATSIISGGDYEMLVVDASCHVTWISYDATSGQSMPADALTGGLLSATNTHLYVSKFTHAGQQVVGYYNPLNRMAWGERGGTKSSSQFEFMVVTYVAVWGQLCIQHILTCPWSPSREVDIWTMYKDNNIS